MAENNIHTPNPYIFFHATATVALISLNLPCLCVIFLQHVNVSFNAVAICHSYIESTGSLV